MGAGNYHVRGGWTVRVIGQRSSSTKVSDKSHLLGGRMEREILSDCWPHYYSQLVISFSVS